MPYVEMGILKKPIDIIGIVGVGEDDIIEFTTAREQAYNKDMFECAKRKTKIVLTEESEAEKEIAKTMGVAEYDYFGITDEGSFYLMESWLSWKGLEEVEANDGRIRKLTEHKEKVKIAEAIHKLRHGGKND